MHAARTVQLRVVLLGLRHRQVHIRSVLPATIVLANREDLVDRAAVLTNLTAKVAETEATTELPERLLAEVQADRRILRRRRRQAAASAVG